MHAKTLAESFVARDSIVRVEAVLAKHKLTALELPEETATAGQAAAAIGSTVKQIVKSLVFSAGPVAMLVLAAGDRQVDIPLLALELGNKTLRLASAAEVKAVTGFSIGAVPPFGHFEPLTTFMDVRFMDESIVFAAAGTRFRVFAVSPDLLAHITKAKLVSVSR